MNLDELERLCREATPKDWIAHPPRVYIGLLEGRPAYVDFCNTPNMDANAQLCAALRNAAPELIAMARAGLKLRALVANDAYAITFQHSGHYRTALLKAFDAAMQEQKP